MAAELLFIAGVPVAVALGTSASGSPNPTVPNNVAPNGGPLSPRGAVSSGSTVGAIIAQPMAPVGSSGGRFGKLSMINRGSVATGMVGVATDGFKGPVSPTNGIDPALQQKLDEIERYTEAAYNKLDSDARDVARGELNRDLKLDPPLPADASWKDISGAVGAAVGGAAGAYIGGPIGAKIGALVGAYLGVKLEELISKNVDEIKAWFKSKWSDIEDWVKGVGSDIEDGVSDAIDYLGSIF